jgi:hypothetical protein
MTCLPNVDDPLAENANLSGMSGGPRFRLIPAEDRIELSAFIDEGRWDIGVIFARQGCLITARGELAPVPLGVRQRTLRPPEDE